MSSRWLESQRAESEYRRFHAFLSASQAEFVPLGGQDTPVTAPIEVSRQEVLNCFLGKNPEFEPFRAELAEFRREYFPTVFTLHKQRWEAISKKT